MMRRGVGAIAAAAVFVAAAEARAGEEPYLYVPGQSVALPDGALSPLANPAGLGLAAADLRLQATFGGAPVGDDLAITHRRGSGLGAFGSLRLGPAGVGAAVERVDAGRGGLVASRATAAASIALADALHVGASAKWIDLVGASVRTFDVGALVRPWTWLSVGAKVQALGESDRPAAAWPTRARLGVALRPVAGGDRLTAAFDLGATVGGATDWTAVAIARIVDGVELFGEHQQVVGAGSPSTHRSSLGLRIGLGATGVAAAATIAKPAAGDAEPGLAIGARLSGDEPPSLLDDGEAAVTLLLRGELSERHGAGDTHFASTLIALDRIARQPGTAAVVIRTEAMQADWAQAEELRTAILALRAAGKKVVWYADDLGTHALGIAAACNRVWIAPGGMVDVHGVGADFVSLADALTRVGIAVQVVRHAAHKSAGERLDHAEPSPELRAALDHAVTRRWADLTAWVAAGRDVSPSALEAALASGTLFPADAKAARLVDEVVPMRDLDERLRAIGWAPPGSRARPWQPTVRRRVAWGAQPEIAVVEIEGAIGHHRDGSSVLGRTLGGAAMARTIEQVERSGAVRAIVARIASPGGSIFGSEAMREALAKAARRKPTVASLGGVAASGGFWTSLGADHVFADAATITGSIGVLSIRPSVGGLLSRHGVRTTSFGAGPGAGIHALTRPWTADEVNLVHRQLGRFYGMFLDLTAERRGLPRAGMDALAGGRVWFGDEAVERRLVDAKGGLLAALARARAKAGLDGGEDPRLRFVPEPGLVQRIKRAIGLAEVGAAEMAALRQVIGPWLDAGEVLALIEGGAPLARIDAAVDGRGR